MKERYYILLLLALAVLIRLPQLLNSTIALDGDECVFAMMVKHTIQGRELPLYFYGQRYAFSFIEILFCIPLSLILGVTTLSIKASILGMWLIGVAFFYKALKAVNKGNSLIPLILTLILVTTPAWGVWSMKARGGYMTAFMLSPIILFLLFDNRYNKKNTTNLLCGVLMCVVLAAQPLWAVVLLPILAVYFILHFNGRRLLLFATSTIAIWLLLYQYKTGLPNYTPTYLTDMNAIVNNVERIPTYVYQHLLGKHYLEGNYPENLFNAAFAYVFMAVMLLTVVYTLYHLAITKSKDIVLIAAVAGMLMPMAATLLSDSIQPRFLLPLSCSVLFPLQLILNKTQHVQRIVVAAGSVLAISGLVAIVTFWNFQSGRMSRTALKEMIQHLDQQGVKHVFVTYAVLDFQLMFYADERIIARNKWPPGRYPDYFKTVDSAYNNGAKTAIVGYPGEWDGMPLKNVYTTADFFIAVEQDDGVVRSNYPQ